jgi:hypothetical protein
VIKRVTLVARAIAKNGGTAKTSRKIKAPAIKAVSKWRLNGSKEGSDRSSLLVDWRANALRRNA